LIKKTLDEKEFEEIMDKVRTEREGATDTFTE